MHFRRLLSKIASKWECLRCGTNVAGGLICRSCEGLRPPVKIDFQSAEDVFGALELPVKWETNRTVMDANFRRIIQRLHPDRHQREQEIAASHAAMVSQSIALLRDPLDRAALVLRYRGQNIPAPSATLALRLIEMEENASTDRTQMINLLREQEADLSKRFKTKMKVDGSEDEEASKIFTEWAMTTRVLNRIMNAAD